MIRKIVDPILTTNLMDTMTIRIKKIITDNVFGGDGEVSFNESDCPGHKSWDKNTGAITYLASIGQNNDCLESLVVHCGLECIEEFSLFSGHQYRIWCFVSDGLWQVPTRVIRYKKLWKYHRELLDAPGIGEIGQEFEFQSRYGIRFASMVEVSGEALIKALRLVRTNASCAIALSCRQDMAHEYQVRSFFDSAFYSNDLERNYRINFAALAVNAYFCNDALLRVWGFFDDVEASADLIANHATIEEFAKYLQRTKGDILEWH